VGLDLTVIGLGKNSVQDLHLMVDAIELTLLASFKGQV